MAPDNSLTIECVISAISQCPRGAALLVDRKFNVDLAVPRGKARDEDIPIALATSDLEDMSSHFLPCRKSWVWDGHT